MTTQTTKTAQDIATGAPSRVWGHVTGVSAFLVIVVFIPYWAEAFTMPKVIVLTVLAFATIPLIWARRTALTANRIPLALAAAFVALALISQLFSGAPQAISWWGEWFRRSGSLTVLAIGLILAAAAVLTRSEIKTLLAWIVWASVPATAYGLIQVAGADPYEWTDAGWVVSTFGNPNFAAAGLAMLAILTAGLALISSYATIWRILMVPLALLTAFTAVQTTSSQGVFALAAGIGVAALVWLARWTDPRRAAAALGVLAVGVLGAIASVLGMFGIGPLVALMSLDTLIFRQWYWQAALGMAGSHPILGVGPDGYGRFYGEYRIEGSIENVAIGASNAHNVPLQWAATIGFPAAVIYLAFMITVVVIVARRLWAQGPTASPLLIAVAGVWAAYQVQSLVSIDSIPIVFLGWLSTGLLLALTRSEGPPYATASTPAPMWVAAAVLAAIGALLWLPATLASNASRTVVQGTTEADVVHAVGLVEGTTLPCDPSVSVARWTISVAPSELTVGGVFAGADANDRCYGLISAATDFSLQLEQTDQALRYAQQGVTIDPLNYQQWILLARAEHLAGNDAEAQAALQRALELNPNAAAEITTVAEDLGLS